MTTSTKALAPTITDLSGVVLPPKETTLEERIKDGVYNYSNPNITDDCFPITLDGGSRQLVLVHFGVDVRSDEVEQWAKAHGYKLALNDDLLAVGAHPEHKNLQRQFSIIQLGSSTVFLGERHVSYLYGEGAGRRLGLNYYHGSWRGHCHFLLRKISPESFGEDPGSEATRG